MTHGPDGKFVGRGQMLGAWLPKLLDWCWGMELEEMLKAGMRFCELQAAERLQQNANGIRGEKAGEEGGNLLWSVGPAQSWVQRRAVLLRALKELREVK